MRSKKSKEFNFITVQIGDYAYDYPKNTPLPRIGELITIDGRESARVVDVSYIINDSTSNNPGKMITIYTELDY